MQIHQVADDIIENSNFLKNSNYYFHEAYVLQNDEIDVYKRQPQYSTKYSY